MKPNKNILPHLKVHLLTGKTITHNQAQEMWGTNRLAEYIRRLRKQMTITTTMVHEGNDVYGVYSLPVKKENRIKTREYLAQSELKRY
jgi:hypothetical protein